ncbi:MAG: hypothetical protein KatS3mg002_0722 [Candidatus Woesearchaeota archaeon]|nr:MAG: hypothetical protein KatS3mg002_0722 [Candidatus Woesearchaeota archaeon]
MKDIESEILNKFRNEPKEYDTTELAKAIFPEYANIERLINSPDKNLRNEGKKQKFQLHRKLLYYLNKLVDEHILVVSKIKEKGEKVFVLAIDEGNIVIEKGYKKITITKPAAVSNYIEKYEKEGLMKKFDEQTWISRLNAIMIECSVVSLEKSNMLLRELFNSVNDVVAFNDFQRYTRSDYESFLQKISQISLDLDKTVTLIINFEDIDLKLFKSFITKYALIASKRINLIFNINSRDLQRHSEIFEHIIREFSERKIKINIKNKDLYIAPSIMGRSGMYTFDDQEYLVYTKSIKGRVIGLSCSQSSIALNMNKFFEIYNSDSEFRRAIINAAKVLLLANAVQRRKNNEYFRGINNQNTPYSADFYRFSKNYIRLWNYDWHKDLKNNKEMISLLNSTKEVVENFCISEETIFKSCGIPIRFRIALSSAFRNFDVKFMGEREYRKTTVNGINDYYSGEIKDFIIAREKIFEIFDGCDRLRLFRGSDFSTDEVLREMLFLLNNYKIPFFTYDFSQLRGTVKLTNFFA